MNDYIEKPCWKNRIREHEILTSLQKRHPSFNFFLYKTNHRLANKVFDKFLLIVMYGAEKICEIESFSEEQIKDKYDALLKRFAKLLKEGEDVGS